jgi:hypothetical protein
MYRGTPRPPRGAGCARRVARSPPRSASPHRSALPRHDNCNFGPSFKIWCRVWCIESALRACSEPVSHRACRGGPHAPHRLETMTYYDIQYLDTSWPIDYMSQCQCYTRPHRRRRCSASSPAPGCARPGRRRTRRARARRAARAPPSLPAAPRGFTIMTAQHMINNE